MTTTKARRMWALKNSKGDIIARDSFSTKRKAEEVKASIYGYAWSVVRVLITEIQPSKKASPR